MRAFTFTPSQHNNTYTHNLNQNIIVIDVYDKLLNQKERSDIESQNHCHSDRFVIKRLNDIYYFCFLGYTVYVSRRNITLPFPLSSYLVPR